jgi:hypothetical protein
MEGTLIQTYLALRQKAWGSLGQNISQNRNLYRAQGKSYLRVVDRDWVVQHERICHASVFSPWNLKQPA